jgi:hypothetical protein
MNQLLGRGGQERIEELLYGRTRSRADELGGDTAVPERFHRGDALDLVRLGQPWVGVDIDLDQVELARASCRRSLEDRAQLTAGTAPFSPEIDYDRNLVAAVENRGLEGGLRDVHGLDGSGGVGSIT